jgi:acetyl-CoA carboxylase carboxyl transferase subunit alpha
MKSDLIRKLKELSTKDLPELLEARYQRFRKY